MGNLTVVLWVTKRGGSDVRGKVDGASVAGVYGRWAFECLAVEWVGPCTAFGTVSFWGGVVL